MPTIQISVTEKRVDVAGSPIIVCGNSDYTVEWTLDSEWDSLTSRTAHFEWYKEGKLEAKDVSFTGDTVSVPALYGTTEVAIMLYAGDIHTSEPALIPCIRTVKKQDEPEPVPPSPTPQIAAIYGHLENDALATLTESAVYQKDSSTDLAAAQAWAEANFPIPCTFGTRYSNMIFQFDGMMVIPESGRIKAENSSYAGFTQNISGDNHFKMFVTQSHIIFASGKVSNGTFTAHDYAIVGKDKDGAIGFIGLWVWGVNVQSYDPIQARIISAGTSDVVSAYISRSPSTMTLLYNVQSQKSTPSVFGDMFFAFNVQSDAGGGRLNTATLNGTQYYLVDHAVFFTETEA